MRKILRHMAKVKMAQAGYTKINRRVRFGWREAVKAYPVNTVTGEKMAKNFHGRKRNKKGCYKTLFAY